jgi:pimeloyl-ACP methyl ester carboxylesterase
MQSARTVSVNGIELFLREQGAGPLVILCHGWPELSYSWRHQIPAIAEAGYHVVAPDMRGFGRTSAPEDVDAYSIFDHVGDMVALVAALGQDRAAIVGHDWGAPVAWHAAMFRPSMPGSGQCGADRFSEIGDQLGAWKNGANRCRARTAIRSARADRPARRR